MYVKILIDSIFLQTYNCSPSLKKKFRTLKDVFKFSKAFTTDEGCHAETSDFVLNHVSLKN